MSFCFEQFSDFIGVRLGMPRKHSSKSRGKHPPAEPAPDTARESSPEMSPRRPWRPVQPDAKSAKKRRHTGSPRRRSVSPERAAAAAAPVDPASPPPVARRGRSPPPTTSSRPAPDSPEIRKRHSRREHRAVLGPDDEARTVPASSLLVASGRAITGGRLGLLLESTLSPCQPDSRG